VGVVDIAWRVGQVNDQPDGLSEDKIEGKANGNKGISQGNPNEAHEVTPVSAKARD
jgi:hypothetical protein